MDRSIGRILKDTGFDHADPAALQSLRLATDTSRRQDLNTSTFSAPEDELARNHAFLTALRGEESETDRSYVPKNFPDFPSKHTYSATPVFTERDNDPRKIREQAADDGRHGEEALRRLASAAHRDNPTNTIGRDKKPWGRKMESMESMFEKTVKGLSKRIQKEQKGPSCSTAGDCYGH
ncbi:hypothetical protein N7470_005422 [Penicillium chermesinum]|nr:hypothetical protein N7470_005422 [Penicillium chermesinum]